MNRHQSPAPTPAPAPISIPDNESKESLEHIATHSTARVNRSSNSTIINTDRSSNSTIINTANETKKQAMFYVTGFLFTYFLTTTLFIMITFTGGTTPFPLLLLQGITLPLQGFWNFITFIRPTFNIATSRYPDASIAERLYLSILRSADGPLRRCEKSDNQLRVVSRLGKLNMQTTSWQTQIEMLVVSQTL